MKKMSLAFYFPAILTLVCCKQKEQHRMSENLTVAQPAASKNIIASKMVHIPAGTFHMGTDDPAFPDAYPIHKVSVQEFWMDEHEVTNAEFAKFVKATNYVTVAERKLDPKKIIRECLLKV